MVIISVMAVSMCGVILSFIRRSWSWSEGFSAPLAALNIAQISEICKTSFNVLTWVLDFLSVATVLMPETLMDLAAIIDYTKEAALLSPVETKLKKLLTVPLLFIYLFLMWNNISWSISNKRWIFLLSPGQSSALSSVPLHAYIFPPVSPLSVLLISILFHVLHF